LTHWNIGKRQTEFALFLIGVCPQSRYIMDRQLSLFQNPVGFETTNWLCRAGGQHLFERMMKSSHF
jgi:hypothetical protein